MFGSQVKVDSRNGQNTLNNFDFSSIEDMDPSLSDGFNLLYDRELPVQIKFEENNMEVKDLSQDEPLRIRIFQKEQTLKMDVNSENDLFFYYQHVVDEYKFNQIRDQQQFHIDFKEYPSICMKSLNRCEKEPELFTAVFIIQNDGKGRLDILQTTEYKNIELIHFDLQASVEDEIRSQITFRYGSLKSKLSLMEGRLQDINDLLRLKNPSLLLQMQKSQPNLNRSTYKK